VAERKWECEMREKFGEEFEPVDGSKMRTILLNAVRDGEWSDKYKRLILPYSILTQELFEGQQRKGGNIPGLESLDKSLKTPPQFDLVIVDEAHHVRNSTAKRHQAVEYFCKHADAVVFMTATPIQLGDNDLYTLLKLLFPDDISEESFVAMAEPNAYITSALRGLRRRAPEADVLADLEKAAGTTWGRATIAENSLYRRIKEQLAAGGLTREQRVEIISDIESLHSFYNMINRTRRQDIEKDFCIREAVTLRSEFTPLQKNLYEILLKFEAKALATLYQNVPAGFLMNTISRQAASCIFGLKDTMLALTEKRLSQVMDEQYYDDDDNEVNINDVNIDRLLPDAQEIIRLAENLPEDDDPKFAKLAAILKEKQNQSNNKVIIFSSFRHTLNYLEKNISKLGMKVEQINGSVKDEDRYLLRKRFESTDKNNPDKLDILLFTEVGSEGLDYQFCDTLVNYDLPWNPMRIEQRIGRIDRRGQKSEKVRIYNCITNGTIDAEIHERCLQRIGVFERSIGECSDILGKMADSIQKIAFDTKLTAEERAQKLEVLADNEVRHVREMQQLENQKGQMFGLDIPGFDEDVKNAENRWIDPDSLKNLVVGYLRNRLKTNKEYIRDKRLSLELAEKYTLLKDYEDISGEREDIWATFLKHPKKTSCKVVFELEDAKDDPKAFFITPQHPLVRQAAKHTSGDGEMRAALKTAPVHGINPGEYPFLLYTWEYKGNRPRVELVAVCTDETAQAKLPEIIKNAAQTTAQFDKFETEWAKLEEKHINLWLAKKDRFQEDARAHCRFKTENLKMNTDRRIETAKLQLAQACQANNQEIITMKKGEIENATANFNAKKINFEKKAEESDIHFTPIFSGVLIVEGE
jgi:superfamily II DNA/RNA helicase